VPQGQPLRRKPEIPMDRPPVASSLIAVSLFVTLWSGCGFSQQTHFVRPDRRIGGYENVFVLIHPGDSWKIGQMIGDRLRYEGFRVWESDMQPKEAEVVVLYEDRWMWDLSMYMVSLKIEMREARTNELLASTQSYRTSLLRMSPELMVDEVLDRVLAGGGP
jgi:hypothetical protein